jgi:hypothetical protein
MEQPVQFSKNIHTFECHKTSERSNNNVHACYATVEYHRMPTDLISKFADDYGEWLFGSVLHRGGGGFRR